MSERDEAVPAVTVEGEQWWPWMLVLGSNGKLDKILRNRALTTDDLAALLAALSPEQAQRIIATLCNTSADYSNMVDAACNAEAERVLAMSDEEMDAELRAHGADPERIHRWAAATGRWIRLLCDEQEKRRKAEAELERVRSIGAAGWRRHHYDATRAGNESEAEICKERLRAIAAPSPPAPDTARGNDCTCPSTTFVDGRCVKCGGTE